MKNNIAIWMTHGLGDVVMSIPFLKDYTNKNNTYHIFIKGKLQKDLIKLFCDSEIHFEFYNLSSGKFLFYKSLFKKFDIFIFLHGTRKFKSDLILRFLNTKKIILPEGKSLILKTSLKKFDIVKRTKNHKVNYYRQFGKLEKIDDYNIDFSVNSKNPILMIAPGSGEIEKHKRLLAVQWAELINLIKIKNNNLQIIVFHSRNEINLFKEINKYSKYELQNFIPNSIQDSVDFIKKTKYCITVCNGTSHMTSLLKIPTLGIYGPTNPFFTGVFGKYNRIYRLGYACSPCYRKDFITGCGNNRCMSDIDMNLIFLEFMKLKEKKYTKSNYIDDVESLHLIK